MTNATHLYKRRWVFLCVLIVLQLICSYNFAGFGQINDVYAGYFKVTYAQTDWMTIASFAGVVLISPFLAALSYFHVVALRNLIITAAVCVLFAFLCISTSLVQPLLFPLLVIGQLFNGCAGAILVSIPSIFAALWFPDSQIGTAISLNMFGISVGNVLGFIVPVTVLHYPVSDNTTNSTLINNARIVQDRVVLLEMYFSFLSVAIAVAVFFVAFLTDKPPQPPSLCQAAKRDIVDKTKRTFYGFLRDTWALFSLNYAMLALIFGIIFHINAWQYTMMGEMIRFIAHTQQIAIPPDVFGGLIMASTAVSGAVGSVVSGKIVDTYKRFKLQAFVGALAACLFSVGLTLAFYFRSILAIALSNAMFGFAVRICIVPVYELVLEQTYPTDESFVSIWLSGAQTVIGVAAAEVGRIIYDAAKVLPVTIFQTCALFLALVLAAAVKPKYNRRAQQQALETQSILEENTRLVTENDTRNGF